MSSAICFNLDQSQILSSGNGLNVSYLVYIEDNFISGAMYSPKKSIKKKPQPLENIHSLTTLICHLHKPVLDIVDDLEQKVICLHIVMFAPWVYSPVSYSLQCFFVY